MASKSDRDKIKTIKEAINTRQLLQIYYEGDSKWDGKKGQRLLWVQAYGSLKGTGNRAIRAYLVRGTSYSKHQPLWRLYRLDRIRSWGLLDDPNKQLRKDPPLSKRNDKGFRTITTQIKK